jgi:protein gp37
MSDLFHEDLPDTYIQSVAEVMKRATGTRIRSLPNELRDWKFLLNGSLNSHAKLKHIWWGVSVEDRSHGFPRIEELRQSDATVRFLSVEPLLEDLGEIDLTRIHWVIVGGESGPGSRPMKPAWVRSIRDQCAEAGVAFFFKQWGAFGPIRVGERHRAQWARRRRGGFSMAGRGMNTPNNMPKSLVKCSPPHPIFSASLRFAGGADESQAEPGR